MISVPSRVGAIPRLTFLMLSFLTRAVRKVASFEFNFSKDLVAGPIV